MVGQQPRCVPGGCLGRAGAPDQEDGAESSCEEWLLATRRSRAQMGRLVSGPIGAAPSADAVTLSPAPMVKT